jgi:hypothetical protein
MYQFNLNEKVNKLLQNEDKFRLPVNYILPKMTKNLFKQLWWKLY